MIAWWPNVFYPTGAIWRPSSSAAAFALDWPKFSGGKYRHLEPAEARRKLRRAEARQRGAFRPQNHIVSDRASIDLPTVHSRWENSTVQPKPSMLPARTHSETPMNQGSMKPKKFRWLSVPALLLLMVGCAIVSGDDDEDSPSVARYLVEADILNIRANPIGTSEVIAQASRGTVVIPTYKSGVWYGVEMSDGTTGWLHSEFVSPVR